MEMLEYVDPVIKILVALVGFGSFIWGASSYFNSKFASLRAFVDGKIDKLREDISKKLEYHERHDDQRFDKVDSDILAIKLRNAARDGLAINILEDINRLSTKGSTNASQNKSSDK